MTAAELCLKEGELAQCVWLPLALCELVQIGSIIARRAAGELGELKVPKKSVSIHAPAWGATADFLQFPPSLTALKPLKTRTMIPNWDRRPNIKIQIIRNSKISPYISREPPLWKL